MRQTDSFKENHRYLLKDKIIALLTQINDYTGRQRALKKTVTVIKEGVAYKGEQWLKPHRTYPCGAILRIHFPNRDYPIHGDKSSGKRMMKIVKSETMYFLHVEMYFKMALITAHHPPPHAAPQIWGGGLQRQNPKVTKNYCVVFTLSGSEQICKTSKCFFLSSYDWIEGNVSIAIKWSFMYLLRGICWAWRDQGMIMWIALYADRPHGSTTQRGVSIVTAKTKADTETHLQACEKHWPGSTSSTSSQEACGPGARQSVWTATPPSHFCPLQRHHGRHGNWLVKDRHIYLLQYHLSAGPCLWILKKIV